MLGFSHLGDDGCFPRVGDFAMPMVFYGGSGEELAMDAGVPALAQALVPRPDVADEAYPCDLVVTRAEDAAGIWKQYLGRPDLMAPDGMGYHKISFTCSEPGPGMPERRHDGALDAGEVARRQDTVG